MSPVDPHQQSPTEPQPQNAADPESWLQEHGDVLFAHALGQVRDREVAEDLVQETLLAGIEAAGTFAGRSTVRTWLMGILRHKILQHYRRSRRKPLQLDAALPPEGVDEQFNRLGKWRRIPSRWKGDLDGLTERDEFLKAMTHCLDELPARIREAFLLSEQHRLAAEKICNVLDVTATNVYVMLYRARSALRKCLESNWFGGDAGKGC